MGRQTESEAPRIRDSLGMLAVLPFLAVTRILGVLLKIVAEMILWTLVLFIVVIGSVVSILKSIKNKFL